MRKVASLKGVKYFGLPMGTPITADVLEKAREKNKGKPPPKGSSKQTRMTSATPPPPKGIKAPPVEKPAKPAEPTLAERLAGVKAKPPLEGTEHFRVGNSNFSAPEGTRVFFKGDRTDVALVVTPEGELRVFNERGEVAISSRTEARVKAEMIDAGEALDETQLGGEEEAEKKNSAKKAPAPKPEKLSKREQEGKENQAKANAPKEDRPEALREAREWSGVDTMARMGYRTELDEETGLETRTNKDGSKQYRQFPPKNPAKAPPKTKAPAPEKLSEREQAGKDAQARKNAKKVDDPKAYAEAIEWSGVDTMNRLGWRTELDLSTGLETRTNADGSKQYRQFPPDPSAPKAGEPTEYDLRDKPKELTPEELSEQARKQFEQSQKAAETRRRNMAARIAATQKLLELELQSEGELAPVSHEDTIRVRQEKKRVNDLVSSTKLKIRELQKANSGKPLPEHLTREDWMPAGQVLDNTIGKLVADPTATPELNEQNELLETRLRDAERVNAAAKALLQRWDEENPSSEPKITKAEKQALEKKKIEATREQLGKFLKQKKLFQPKRKPDSLGETVPVDPDDIEDLQTSIFSADHLNPDGTFTEERKKLHDEIIASFLEGVEPVAEPIQFMNGGGPASGKGTMTKGRNAELTNYPTSRKVNDEDPEGSFEPEESAPEAILIDPDAMKMQLPEVKEARARIMDGTYDDIDPHWASNAHTESSYLAARLHQAALDRGLNLIFDGTGNGKESSVLSKALKARKSGYRIEANYLYLEPEEGIKRAKTRADRSHRVVPEEIIRGTYENIPGIFDAVKEGVFDKVNLFDNNVDWGEPAKVIGQGEGGSFNITDPEAYARFQRRSDALQQTDSSKAASDIKTRRSGIDLTEDDGFADDKIGRPNVAKSLDGPKVGDTVSQQQLRSLPQYTRISQNGTYYTQELSGFWFNDGTGDEVTPTDLPGKWRIEKLGS